MLRAALCRPLAASRAPLGTAPRLARGAHDHGTPSEPVFLGLAPARRAEAWETVTIATFGLTFVLTSLFLAFGPDTSITSWAKEEAAARSARKQAGEEIEAGRNYSAEALRERVMGRR